MSTESKTKKKGITSSHSKKIWESISLKEWLELFRKKRPDLKFRHSSNTSLLGLCPNPDHADTQPSFFLYSGKDNKRHGHCFGCGIHYSNPVKLYAHAFKLTESAALTELMDEFKLSFLPKKVQSELAAQRLNQLIKNAIYKGSHKYMCDAINDPTGTDYASAKEALDWLVNDRKFDKGILHALPVGILPPLNILMERTRDTYYAIKKDEEAKGHASRVEQLVDPTDDMSKYIYDYVKSGIYTGSIVWPMHVDPATIGRIKLRVPKSAKEMLYVVDDYEEMTGLYGLGFDMYSTILSNSTGKPPIVYVCEGEVDAMTVMAHYAKKGSVSFPLVSAGGNSGSASIEPVLESSGVEKAYLVGDAPVKQGDTVVTHWLEKIRRLHTKVFTPDGWDKLAPGGDLDEAANTPTVGMSKVLDALYVQANKHFIPTWEWAYDQISPELDSLDESDFRGLVEMASNGAKFLNPRLEIDAYVEQVCGVYPQIKVQHLRREITTHEDNEQGFIFSCAEALKTELFIMGTEASDGGRNLICHQKEDGTFHSIKLDSDRSIAQELAPICGTLTNFVSEKVGFPGYMESPDEAGGNNLQEIDRKLRFVLKEAILSLAQGVPDYHAARVYKQGYHMIRNAESNGTMGPKEYLVCGTRVFYLDRDASPVTYRQLEGPRDDKYIFDIKEGKAKVLPWYPGGLTEDKLNATLKVDHKKLYEDLVTYFNTFYFIGQLNTAKLIAAMTMTFPIMNAFDKPTMLFINGDTNSGKSTIMSAFNDAHAPTRLLYCTHPSLSNYSEASISLACDCDSRILTLDEFESGSDGPGQNVRQTLALLRGMQSAEGAKRARAGKDGKLDVRTINMPVIMAAIMRAEKPQDMNRLVLVETQKVAAPKDSYQCLRLNPGYDRIRDMSEELTLGMYPVIPDLLKIYDEIKSTFSDINATLPFKLEQRFASALFPALAVMGHVGADWKEFLQEYVEINKDTITRTITASESERLLSALIYSPVIKPSDGFGGELSTIALKLQDRESRIDISNSSCGAYFDEVSNSLVFLPEQAGPSLLYKHDTFGSIQASAIKDILQRHPHAMSDSEVFDSNMVSRVKRYLGAGIRIRDIVAVRATFFTELEEEVPTVTDDSEIEADVPAEDYTNDTKNTGDPGKKEEPEEVEEAKKYGTNYTSFE